MKCPYCSHENIPGEEVCESCSAPLVELSFPRPEPGLKEKILTHTLTDLKPQKALTIGPGATVREAVELMRRQKTGCVLVSEKGRLLGILTERDLLLGVAGGKKSLQTRVQEVMHKDPACLKASDPISFAFHHMAVGGYRHLPVYLEDNTLAMVSSRDLLRYLT